MFLSKIFNAFMYNHTLHHESKHFCRYCLQAFSTEETLKFDFKDYFNVNCKQRLKMLKKVEHVRLKNHEREKNPYL